MARSTGREATEKGELSTCVSAPFEATSNTATVFEFWLATKTRVPPLLMAMPFGAFPRVGNGEPGIVVNDPSGSMSKAAIVLDTELQAYNRLAATTRLTPPMFGETSPSPPVEKGDPAIGDSAPPPPIAI